MERNCATCAKILTIKNDIQKGYYCCDEYYCSLDCVNESLADNYTNWDNHYSDNEDCCYTEWDIKEELQEILGA